MYWKQRQALDGVASDYILYEQVSQCIVSWDAGDFRATITSFIITISPTSL